MVVTAAKEEEVKASVEFVTLVGKKVARCV